MVFKNLESLLGRFKNITPPDILIRQETKLAIKELLNIDISLKEISFNKKSGVLFIKTKGLNKTLFFINKEKVINKINNQNNSSSKVLDLRLV